MAVRHGTDRGHLSIGKRLRKGCSSSAYMPHCSVAPRLWYSMYGMLYGRGASAGSASSSRHSDATSGGIWYVYGICTGCTDTCTIIRQATLLQCGMKPLAPNAPVSDRAGFAPVRLDDAVVEAQRERMEHEEVARRERNAVNATAAGEARLALTPVEED
ncbi:hypothetical protein VOLCADRAFT_87177 [Volvox carteri f. nagariensis]|uniref:Uncharacterized protein n=1 Tax=Volvox carteri f. nagariensis TaxID=3068 RepID=D8TKD7_VOLCA|nr:uncharacterized protein VOLCADRAFT_87177 [Volvox carteri f. nagariensis]EFJ52229.1 hypothetical protein VOLCADRAFT_87177 [Volvox carteri f. nagariensis]|eukprot:XP_002947003.1 hypothetical protein VOLCADRAFT_87177 [Volvox carteri f. nagariensis]